METKTIQSPGSLLYIPASWAGWHHRREYAVSLKSQGRVSPPPVRLPCAECLFSVPTGSVQVWPPSQYKLNCTIYTWDNALKKARANPISLKAVQCATMQRSNTQAGGYILCLDDCLQFQNYHWFLKPSLRMTPCCQPLKTRQLKKNIPWVYHQSKGRKSVCGGELTQAPFVIQPIIHRLMSEANEYLEWGWGEARTNVCGARNAE